MILILANLSKKYHSSTPKIQQQEALLHVDVVYCKYWRHKKE
jgi:hypothetical protein